LIVHPVSPYPWRQFVLRPSDVVSGVRSHRIWGILIEPGATSWRRLSVVVSSFQDLDFIIVCSVYEPMFVIDPPGPVPGQLPFERLWFSNPRERVALDFSDEPSDPAGHLAVGG
jgi:hypothetical protein